MDITYLGHSSFRIASKLATIITDPFDPKMVGLKYTSTTADIITISHDHEDHNFTPAITGVKKILSGPGEYEIGGVSFIGLSTFHDGEKGAKRGKNTIFIIEADGLRLAHLGDLGHDLSEKDVNAIGEIDVLMIPVGGEYTLGPKEAATVARNIEPKIILPMHFKVDGLSDKVFAGIEKVDAFISELGLKVENLPKLNLKEGGILSDDQTIALLEKK